MTVRSRLGVGAALWLVAIGVGAASLGAQTAPRPHDADALKILVVPAFVSPDKALGCKTAQEVRSRVDDDLDSRKLWIVPQNNIEETLKASGFPPCDPITPSDAKQLSSQLRADAYIDGAVTKAGAGVHVEPKLVLARDPSFAQPMPPVDARNPGDAARVVSKEVAAALKQLPGETKCYQLGGQQKYADAIAAARQAIVAYPQATLARLCIANIYAIQKLPPDSILAAVQPILQIDPHNRRSLELAGQAYYDKKDYDNAVKAWTGLIASDPSNSDMVERIVTQIVQSGHAESALPIMDTVVKANQGDPKLLELQYRLLIVTKHFKQAIPIGEEVVKEDTAFADTLFFQRQGLAYVSDSQPQKAAETLAKGIAKFPNNTSLQTLHAQMLLNAGQLDQAKQELLGILAKNPKETNATTLLLNIYMQQANADSIMNALHAAQAAGAPPKPDLAKLALSLGNKLYKAGNGSKNKDTLDLAIKVLAYSDSLDASPNAKFLEGTSAFTAGYIVAQEAGKEKSCPKARQANDYFANAQVNVPAGLQSYADAAKQVLTAMQQLTPFVAKEIKAFCK